MNTTKLRSKLKDLRTTLNATDNPGARDKIRRLIQQIEAQIEVTERDEEQRRQAPRSIDETVCDIDGRQGTIEQLTDDRVFIRLTANGAYIWVDRSDIV